MASLLRLPYSLLLSVSLVLVLGACKKSDPEPTLEGDWDLISSTRVTYSSTRQQLSQFTTMFPVGNNVGASYHRYTSTTHQLFSYESGPSPAQPYTRSGNEITFYINLPGSSGSTPYINQPSSSTTASTYPLTITQLTTTDLKLFSSDDPTRSSDGYSTYENYYTRR
jgi:hypothetical protein